MPDVFDADGLQVKTKAELIAELETAFRAIYGNDINLEQNSPDGQIIDIFAQQGVDLRELLVSINSGFDPAQAEGVILDNRVGINGIERNGGTFTTVEIDVEVSQALNLVGLDTESNEITPDIPNLYTIRDDAGNEFYLLDSVSIDYIGTDQLSFRAASLGNVEITPNTITTPVSVIAGIVSVNNPSVATVQGVDEESDAELRLRRAISTAISSMGNINGLQAALADLSGVTTSIVRENRTDTIDAELIPPHSIWAIVEGGDDTEIATVIKAFKTSGCNFKGDEEVNIPYNDGRIYIVKFDRPANEDLYIEFTITLPGGVIDNDSLANDIVANIIWGVGQSADSGTITAYLKSLNPNYVITGMEVSKDDITYLELVAPTDSQSRFINDASRISIT